MSCIFLNFTSHVKWNISFQVAAKVFILSIHYKLLVILRKTGQEDDQRFFYFTGVCRVTERSLIYIRMFCVCQLLLEALNASLNITHTECYKKMYAI